MLSSSGIQDCLASKLTSLMDSSSSSSKEDLITSMASPSSGVVLSEAVQLLSRLIEDAATNYNDGNLAASFQCYEQAVLIDPTNNVLYANRSAILLKLGKVEEAIDEAAHSIRLNPKWAKAYYRKAEAHREAKQYEKAAILYAQALELNPNSSQFLSALILCLRMSSIGAKFDSIFGQMKELGFDSSAFVTLSVAGQEYLATGNAEAAISILRIALNIDSYSLKLKESVLGALAKAYFEVQNISKSLDYLELQLGLVTQLNDTEAQAQIHRNIVQVAVAQENYDYAISHSDRHISLLTKMHEPLADAYCIKAEVCEKVGNINDAQESYQLALSDDERHYSANMGLGSILLKQRCITEALAAYSKACQGTTSKDSIVNARIRICQCKMMLGQTNEAVMLLKIILKNNEHKINSKIARNVLEMLCRAAEVSGNLRELHSTAKKMLKLSLTTASEALKAEAFYSLGLYYYKTGQRSNAQRLFELLLDMVENRESALSIQKQGNILFFLSNIQLEACDLKAAVQTTLKKLRLSQDGGNEQIEADSHAELVEIHRKLGDKTKCEEHLQELQKLVLKSNQRKEAISESFYASWVYEYEMGNIKQDSGMWEEAKVAYERALIIVQELGLSSNEAKICEQLGIVYDHTECFEEAIVYLNQFLMISKQQRNAAEMCAAYSHLTKIHVKCESWDEALDCSKFYLSLSGILNDRKNKLSALLILGKIFSKKEDAKTAIEVLIKAKRLAESLEAKRELALCYGYLAECQLKLGQRRRALANFCKQVSYFQYVNDVEDKCETLRHLIEEKTTANDVFWCVKLSKLRQEIASKGSINLQISVLRDSATIMQQLGCIDKSAQCLEQALILSIRSEHSDTVTILLNLCEMYYLTQRYQKAVVTLREFTEVQNDICGPGVYYQLGVMLIYENNYVEAVAQLYKCRAFDMVDNRFQYALACALYKIGDVADAYNWLLEFIQASKEDAKDVTDINHLIWQQLLFEYYALQQHQAIDKIQELVCSKEIKLNTEDLDAFNAYEHLVTDVRSLMPELAQIHYEMATAKYKEAQTLVDGFKSDEQQFIFETLVLHILLQNPHALAIEESILIPPPLPAQLSLFSNNDNSVHLALIALIIISNRQSPLQAMRYAEMYYWMSIRSEMEKAGVEFDTCQPEVEAVRNAVYALNSMVYAFHVDSYTFLWSKTTQNAKLTFSYIKQEEKATSLPRFHQAMLQQVLNTTDMSQISVEKYEHLLQTCETVINLPATSTSQVCQFSLLQLATPAQTLPSETCLLVVDDSEKRMSIEGMIHLNSPDILTVDHLQAHLAQSCIVFLDVGSMRSDILLDMSLLHGIKSMTTKLVVLWSDEDRESSTRYFANQLCLAGVSWVALVQGDSNSKIIAKEFLLTFLPVHISNNVNIWTIQKFFASFKCQIYGQQNSEKNFEVYSTSSTVRRFITNGKLTCDFIRLHTTLELTSEHVAEVINTRVRKILAVFGGQISAAEAAAINELAKNDNPEEEIIKFGNSYDDERKNAIQWMFADWLCASVTKNDDIVSHDLTRLLKSYDVQKKWRRRPKSKKQLPNRGYCSDGEHVALFSDCELTDHECPSGARVVGVDLNDDTDYA